MASDHEQTAPSGIDPSLTQTTPPNSEEAQQIYYEFWHADPTGVWQPYVDKATEALDAGKSFVMLSAFHGSGKSMRFFTGIREHFDDPLATRHIAAIPLESVMPLELFTTNGPLAKHQVLLVDEHTGLSVPEIRNVSDSLANIVQAGKQAVISVPGPSQHLRQATAERTVAKIKETDHEIEYLGDVTDVHIPAERSSALLQQLGAQEGVVELFEQLQALRSPRFFDSLMTQFLMMGGVEAVTKDNVELIIKELIHPPGDVLASHPAGAIGITLGGWDQIRGGVRDHEPFLSTCISTVDCIELYDALDEPLPQSRDFSSPSWYEYAYSKN